MPNAITDGEPKLIPTPDGARLDFSGGQPLMEQGLENAVYLSLFVGDWWGNATVPERDRQASRVQQVADRATLSNRSRLDIEAAANEALGWMVNDGIAESVRTTAVLVGVQTAELTVTIEQPGASPVILRYQVNWDKQRDATDAGRVTRTVGGW